MNATNETNSCLRCETAVDASRFNIGTKVCDSCVLGREIERYERLGGFHPDFSLELGPDEEPLHVKNRRALARLKRLAAERGVTFEDRSEK